MELSVLRTTYTTNSTIGQLSVDGQFECFTLEDVVRNYKVPNQTAIPAGRYQVVVTPSPHFKRDLPLLQAVPDYAGVRIHPGNKADDTEGCLLVGRQTGTDVIMESRIAFEPLFTKIQGAINNGEEVYITITDSIEGFEWHGLNAPM